METSWWRSPILALGAAIWASGLAAWTALLAVDREEAWAAAATLAGFLAAGKIVGITAGFALDAHPVTVWLTIFLPDFGAVVFFHPISQAGLHRLGRWSRFVREALRQAEERQRRADGIVAKHGALGLFALAMVPVGFYSPLVIAALGQIAGLRPRAVITAIGSAMVVMTTFWVLVLRAGLDRAAAVDPRLPWILSILITLIFVGKALVTFKRGRGARHSEDPTGAAENRQGLQAGKQP